MVKFWPPFFYNFGYMNNRTFGCYAEHKFAVMALERGLFVSFPILHSSVYDCIVDSKKGLSKVQIKSIDESNSKFNRVSLRHRNGDLYTLDEVDYFAIYSKQRDGFFIFKNKSLRLTIKIDSDKYSNYFNNFAIL